jgi:predicted RNA-binding protein YlxR (DUF448 family)
MESRADVPSCSSLSHVPQRTCIGCRRVRPKQELLRLVRDEGGGVNADPSRGARGRGAYLCPEPGCWRRGLSKNRLDRALRTKITEDNRERLAKIAVMLPTIN